MNSVSQFNIGKDIIDEILLFKHAGPVKIEFDEDVNIIKEKIEIAYKYIIEENKKSDTILLWYAPSEAIQKQQEKDKLLHIIKNSNHDCKILHSGLETEPYFTNPITNIYSWKHITISNNIADDHQQNEESTISVFPSKLYKSSTPIFYELSKTMNHILSVRRKTDVRDYIIEKINTQNIDIFRYSQLEYTVYDEQNNYNESFPTWNSLLDEYLNSNISFVFETHFGEIKNKKFINQTKWPHTPFSEKTIMNFLTGTMPLIFGHQNIIGNLNNLGFWTLNNEYDYKSIDQLDTYDIKRADVFSEIVNELTSYSNEKIKSIYHSNYDKIMNNYNIMYKIFNSDTTLI